MLQNKERRNGLILTQSHHRSTYGKFNKAPNKARYNLSDIVLELGGQTSGNRKSTTNDFDISNDSFKLSDDEDEDVDENDYAGALVVAGDDTLGSFSDEPYGSTQLISIAISDNESTEGTGNIDSFSPVMRTPMKAITKRKSVLQEISSPNTHIVTQEKRQSLAHVPTLSRNGSSGLKNRSSTHSSSSKRWSLLSFNEDKENVKSKRFSISSIQSGSSKDKSKRFSMASTSSSSSSFKNVVSKVGNVLSSVSINSADASNESTPYKSVKPGVVGEFEYSNKRPLSSSNAPQLSSPVVPRKYSQASVSVATATLQQSSYQNSKRAQEYSNTISGSDFSRVLSNTDQISMLSTNTVSSLKTSRSRFRLSSLFSSSKKDQPTNDNESVRSLRGRSSFSDMRKSVLSMSQSKQSLFRLGKKESLQDLKTKPSVDKMMISLPKPDSDSATKLKHKLQHSSSIISINSIISGAPTVTATTLASHDDKQLKTLLQLTTRGEVLDFRHYIARFANAENQILVKYAEASYSEVFVLKNYKTNENLKIFKVIPFGEDKQEQPSIQNIIQELKVNLKMNDMHGFIKLNESHVVEGCYPKLMMKLWDDYNDLKDSKNFRPEYDPTQKYLIMDLEYGGIDLENFRMLTWSQALEVFWSVVRSLSEAEQRYNFEHRDLHWGNVVIDYKTTSLEDAFQDLSVIEEDCDDELEVKIIDYTLSRLDDAETGHAIFTRLDHQDFFKGRGDYQFDIYRFMRTELKSVQKEADSLEVDWSLSSFKTNLYWLHYLLDKLLNKKNVLDDDDASRRKLKDLHKTLNPRRKKLSDSDVKFFEDFDSCGDVLSYGHEHGLVR